MNTIKPLPEQVYQSRSKLMAFALVMGKTCSILLGRPLRAVVEPQSYSGAPAWATRESLHLDEDSGVKTILAANGIAINWLLPMMGLAYHELSHVLFTDWDGLEANRNRLGGYKIRIWNQLEDARIETLFTSKYPAAAKYFKAAVLKFILSWDRNAQNSGRTTFTPFVHFLLCGRLYVPRAVRAKASKEFFLPAEAATVRDLTYEYLTLTFPQNWPRAIEIVDAIDALIPDDVKRTLPDDQTHNGTLRSVQTGGHGKVSGAILKEKAKEADKPDAEASQEAKQKVQGQIDKEKKESGSGDSPDKGKEQSKPGQGKADSGKGKGKGSAGGTDGPTADGDPSGGAGSSSAPRTSSLMDAVLDALDQSLDSSEVVSELKTMEKNIRGVVGSGRAVSFPRLPDDGFFTPSPEARAYVSRISKKLNELKADADAAWEHSNAGRLNVDCALQADAAPGPGLGSEVFDLWTDNEQATHIEVVLLADVSSSITFGALEQPLSEAVWLLRSAITKAGGSVTTLAFNSEPYVIADKSERVEKDRVRWLRGSGGTDPTSALERARYILSRADHDVFRLLVVITDGQWTRANQPGGADQLIQELNGAGVLTTLYGLGAGVEKNNHNCTIAKDVSGPADVVPLVTALVRRGIRGKISHV